MDAAKLTEVALCESGRIRGDGYRQKTPPPILRFGGLRICRMGGAKRYPSFYAAVANDDLVVATHLLTGIRRHRFTDRLRGFRGTF